MSATAIDDENEKTDAGRDACSITQSRDPVFAQSASQRRCNEKGDVRSQENYVPIVEDPEKLMKEMVQSADLSDRRG